MFKVTGVSTFKGETKVRFANDMTRVKALSKAGNTDIELIELKSAMDKPACVTFLKSSALYANPKFQAAIDEADLKYNGEKTVKVKVKAAAKTPKATTKKSEKATPSLDKIRVRGQRSASQILAETPDALV